MRHAVFSLAESDNSVLGELRLKEIGNQANVNRSGPCSSDSKS